MNVMPIFGIGQMSPKGQCLARHWFNLCIPHLLGSTKHELFSEVSNNWMHPIAFLPSFVASSAPSCPIKGH